MSDEWRNIINEDLTDNDKRISELEKKVEIFEMHNKYGTVEQILNNIEEMKKTWDINIEDVLNQMLEALHKRDERIEEIVQRLDDQFENDQTFEKEIAELRKDFYSHASLIVELKEQIKNIWDYLPSDLGEQITEERQRGATRQEVLRELINNILLIKRKSPSESYDFLVGLLAKLEVGSARQTEKKEDSEALKAIKKLAREESDFYDKHGYYSFWSDALKFKRIKEMKEKKGCHNCYMDVCLKRHMNRRCEKYLPKKASGGEKLEGRNEQIEPDCSHYDDPIPNSKPPEPTFPPKTLMEKLLWLRKFLKDEGYYEYLYLLLNEIIEECSRILDEKPSEPKPREDDVIHIRDMVKTLTNKEYLLVKREDLEKPYKDMIKDLEYWQTTNKEGISTMYILSDLKSKYARRLGKLKEERVRDATRQGGVRD